VDQEGDAILERIYAHFSKQVESDETTSPQELNESIWALLVKPVVDTIVHMTASNPLLPVFFVENPYPLYSDKINAAIQKAISGFTLIDLNEIREDRLPAFLSQQVVNFTESKKTSGIVLTAASKNTLPKTFRSLVRVDGYLSITPPTATDLSMYAEQFRGLSVNLSEIDWLKWLGPQELLVANLLSNEHWLIGLEQLAKQKQVAQLLGKSLSLNDIYGAEAAKRWAKQLFNDINLARKGSISWSEVDKGALFYGAPGTGKTTIARAIASECGVSFIAIAPAADWTTGNGLDENVKKIKETFALARQQAPTILFIDEIDSIGNRDEFSGQNASYNTQLLNALLTEIDGFDERDRIIVIGATNYPDNVDSALRRSGRLDRLIRLSLPDSSAIKAMIRGVLARFSYANNLTEENLHQISTACIGLSGADIEVIIRGARRRARVEDSRPIEMSDLLDEIYKIPPDADRKPLSHIELANTANHEAGHALVALLLPTHRARVRFATIIPNNEGALGFVSMAGQEQNETKESLLDKICVCLAGRAAEVMIYGIENTTTGAGGAGNSNDLSMAHRLAMNYLGYYGFSDKTPNCWSEKSDDYEQEAKDIVLAQFERSLSLLKSNRANHARLVQLLLDKQAVSVDEMQSILEF
jgi:ATP-dependent Zn protease